ncbi:hypothetical protein P4679_31650 [Priestia megaterium]|uniref:hypothetical protein n=1 Tax=Priestia megaterium TaxID=1404 RepID=UPI002E1D16E5|nr:hypothetical protein [Priestia megaterium]
MNILHFCPKAKQIRFFRTIKAELNANFSDQPEFLFNYWNVGEFLRTLRERTSQLDAIIISAHGWEDAILKPIQGTFTRTITMEDAPLFTNKFVFANSCYTARKFGPELVKNGAFTFIGFNDSIGEAFSSNNQYKEIVEKIFKRIYTTSLANSFTAFVKKCLTTSEFCEYIDFQFRKSLNTVMKMKISDINSSFQVSIEESNKDIIKLVKLEFIEKFDDLKNKIVLVGEKNYIYWHNIKNLSVEDLKDRLEKIEGISENNNLYKYFIKLLIYLCLDDQISFLNVIEQFYIELKKMDGNIKIFNTPFELQKEFEKMKEIYAG